MRIKHVFAGSKKHVLSSMETCRRFVCTRIVLAIVRISGLQFLPKRCFRFNMLLAADFYVEIFDTPVQRFLMRVEKYVEASSMDGATPVENLYRLSVSVAGNNHFGPKRVGPVGSYEAVALAYSMAGGCYAV